MKIFNLCCLVLGLWFIGMSANAATYTVTTAADDTRSQIVCNATECALRAALRAASADTDPTSIINFDLSLANQTISLAATTNGPNLITLTAHNVIINGLGANRLTIDRGGVGHVLQVILNGGTLTLNDVTITGGNYTSSSTGGAGLLVTGNTNVNINRARFTNNTTQRGGGAIYFAGGGLNITDSTFSDNTANSGGAIELRPDGPVVIKNSTFSGNSAVNNGSAGVGGALSFILATLGTGAPVSIWNCTITNNSADGAGGIYVQVPQQTLTLGNTIVAGNSGSNFPELVQVFLNSMVSQGFNHIGDSSGDSSATNSPIAWQGTDTRDTPPMLGALTIANGGPTPTHIPLAGSPLINSGSNALATSAGLTRDQRGYVRMFGGITDKGATEFGLGPTAATASLSGRVLTASGRPVFGAEVILTNLQGVTVFARTSPFGYYQFYLLDTGQSYVLSATAKGRRFQLQLILVNGDLTGQDLLSLPDEAQKR